MLWISFLCTNKPSVAPCCLHICDSCTRIAQEKSGERYPNSVVSFGLNRAYIKIQTPNSPCTDNTWFFEYFYGFLGFVVWEISGHFWGVYQSHYCASAVAFLFSFVYVIYLNIASYLYGKQIKSKFGLSCIYEWFSFVYAWIGYISMSAVPCPLTPYKRRRLYNGERTNPTWTNGPTEICLKVSIDLSIYREWNWNWNKSDIKAAVSQILTIFCWYLILHNTCAVTCFLAGKLCGSNILANKQS